MAQIIRAIYENNVLRPLGKVLFREHERVKLRVEDRERARKKVKNNSVRLLINDLKKSPKVVSANDFIKAEEINID